MSNQEDREKRDNENYSKNFTRIPNIVFASYKYLSKEEKYLYGDLRYVYWDTKPRYVTLRELHDMTGYSIGALSKMLPRLHACGLIHAEVRREKGKDGKEKGNPKYHITILDIWELNRKFFSCSPNEQVAMDPSRILVHEKEQACSPNEQDTGDLVHQKTQGRSPNEQDRAQSELTKKDIKTITNKTNRKKEESERVQNPTSVSSSSLSLAEKNEPEEKPIPELTQAQGVTPPTVKENAARRSLAANTPAKVEKSNALSYEEQKIYDALSPAARKIYAEWCQMPWLIVRPELTRTLATHLETATAYQSLPLTAETMLKVKEHATSPDNDTKGYYKKHGWNFKFMLNELPQWLAVNGGTGKQGGSQSTTSGMDEAEAQAVARDAIAKGKTHGYDIKAHAVCENGVWVVRIDWDGDPLRMRSQAEWDKTFAENYDYDQQQLLKGAK